MVEFSHALCQPRLMIFGWKVLWNAAPNVPKVLVEGRELL
jgi:hypothetical protein